MSTVSIILGSDSDIDIFSGVSSILEEFDIRYEKRIISAHRTPHVLQDYVEDAQKRGTKIFIAIAGMAAALPGVIAAYTTLPVIGVPVAVKSPVMGFDSLFSMVQMPPGVPVATVAVNGGKNAALLAVRILSMYDTSMREHLELYGEKQREKVILKDRQFNEE